MLKQMFDQVREKNPLIHNITNYVTVNDCANMVLACGASPIMADDKRESGPMSWDTRQCWIRWASGHRYSGHRQLTNS